MADIEKIWILSCVFFDIKTTASTDVHNGALLTWSEASDTCDGNELEFRESILLKESNVLTSKTFWLGKAIYSKTSAWMEILGCYDSTGLPKLTGVSSIRECQAICLSRSPVYFGYRNTTQMCICSIYIPRTKHIIQNCMSKIYTNSFFFYKVYKGQVVSKPDEHCTTLYCHGGHNNLNATNCLHGTDGSIAGRCGNDGPNVTSWSQNHDTSLDICMNKNQLLLAPLQYCTKGHRDQSIKSWTNVFREVYEYELTKAEGGNSTLLHCLSGHLVQHYGQWKLNKTKRNCNKQLEWYMCRRFFTTKPEVANTKTALLSVAQTTVTDFKTLPSIVHITEKYTVISTPKNGRTSYVMSSTETSGIKNVGQNNHHIDNSEEDSSSKTIGAVIGGLLGVCSVIALLAVLFVCKLRSIGVFKNTSTHDKQEPSQMEFSKATYQDSNITPDNRNTKPTSNEAYGLVENSTTVYAVVNKIKTPENINETYTDAGFGEYDHLHDIQNRRIIHQENMYQSHGAPKNEEDQTYDSSDFGKGKCNNGNSLYDQSCSLVEGEYSYSTNKNPDNSNTIGIYDKIT